MQRPWTAEIEVSADLAQALIESQFAELAPIHIEPLGVGWDNTAYRVNGEYVFRFPRRQIAIELILTETRLLPLAAPRLPLPVPLPEFVGQPTEHYPWPFSGYRMLAGRTACAAGLDERQRTAAAEPLARFLAALHAIDADEAAARGAGPDNFGRLVAQRRVPLLQERLQHLAQAGLIGEPQVWLAILAAAPSGPRGARPVLVHGDLYVRHLLVDQRGRLSGVIDWGDLHLNSPALDLAIAHTFLPASAHEQFRRAYGLIDEETWRLARFRALDEAITLVTFGHETGDADLLREGQWAFAQLRHN